VPLVGRAHPRGSVYSAPAKPNYSGIDTEGSYRYGGKATPRPRGLADKLPKTLKWQDKKSNDELKTN
jgi:hypothetical protein